MRPALLERDLSNVMGQIGLDAPRSEVKLWQVYITGRIERVSSMALIRLLLLLFR